jgi:NADH dehydrogenase
MRMHENTTSRIFVAVVNEYEYDYIILSAGSVTNYYNLHDQSHLIQGVESVSTAITIRNTLNQWLDSGNSDVYINGAGFTGLELALAIHTHAAKQKKPVTITLLERGEKILAFLPDDDRLYIENYFSGLGIHVRLETSVSDVRENGFTLNGSDFIDNGFLCWTAGSKNSLSSITGKIDQLPDGRIKVLDTLQIPGYINAFAAGDSAAIADGERYLRKAVQFAVDSGALSGTNIRHLLTGRDTIPYIPEDPGWVVPLHRVSVGNLFGKRIHGKTGVRLHFLFCGYRQYSLGKLLAYFRRSLFLP